MKFKVLAEIQSLISRIDRLLDSERDRLRKELDDERKKYHDGFDWKEYYTGFNKLERTIFNGWVSHE